MELRQLRYFVAVARKRHFTHAAEELSIAQPALSQQIQHLERELGVLLLDRTSRRVRLTPEGSTFLVHAERILADLEQARTKMQAFAELARGRVVIGALHSLGIHRLPALLAKFHRLYPGIEVLLREEEASQLIKLLEASHVDIILMHVSCSVYLSILANPKLVTESLFTEELVLVMASRYALAHRQSISLKDLPDEPFILFKPASGLQQAILQVSTAAGFAPRILFECDDLETTRALVAEGLGITVLPRSMAEGHGREVALVSPGQPALTRTVLLAWHATTYHSPAVTAFLTFIRNEVGTGLVVHPQIEHCSSIPQHSPW